MEKKNPTWFFMFCIESIAVASISPVWIDLQFYFAKLCQTEGAFVTINYLVLAQVMFRSDIWLDHSIDLNYMSACC